VRGEFGNVPLGKRTAGSELFVNPLMAMYFAVDLGALARRNLYLPRLHRTRTIWDVAYEIEAFRDEVDQAGGVRTRRAYPH
jgi:hypothetical protein